MKRLRLYLLFSCLLFVISCRNEKQTDAVEFEDMGTVEEVKQEPLVRPPFEKARLNFEEIIFDADSGKTFLCNNGYGTSVKIPGGIFIDSAGNPLQGKIRLQFRELHTVNDYLVAGVPLNYDAAGMLKRFNTAGMVELRAWQDGKTVYLDSGKVITINMASFNAGEQFHAFYLDEENMRDWEYVQDLEGVENTEKKKLIHKARARVNEFNIPFSGEYFAFNYMALLDVYLNDKTVEIKKNRQDLTLQGKIKEYGVTWSNIYCYQSVEFKGQKMLASLLLWQKLNQEPWPVWASSATCNLVDNNNGTFTVELSQTKGKGKYTAQIRPFYPIKSLLAFSPSYWKNRYNLAVRKAIEGEMSKNKMADVFRSFEVHQFGIYAAARLQNEEDYIQVVLDPDFKVVDKITEIFYVSEMYHTVLRYPAAEWENMTLLPDGEAKIFTLLPDGRLLVVPGAEMRKLDFKALKKSPGTVVTLPFKPVEGSFDSPAAVAKVLGISVEPV